MPDYEINEGYVEAGRRRADSPLESRSLEVGEPVEPVESVRKLPEETPIVRRTRHLATGHFSGAGMATPRLGERLMARRRRLARRACPYGWQVRVLSTPVRARRQLWTTCHGSGDGHHGSLGSLS
ncbi:MAG TPA: hypothetical protein VGI24_00600 [Solirubrobacteraceae bacterium]|jgi:hypothetical protein